MVDSLFSLAVIACDVLRKGLRPITAGEDRVGVSIRPTRTGPERLGSGSWMLAYRAHHTPLDTLTVPHGSARDPIHAGLTVCESLPRTLHSACRLHAVQMHASRALICGDSLGASDTPQL